MVRGPFPRRPWQACVRTAMNPAPASGWYSLACRLPETCHGRRRSASGARRARAMAGNRQRRRLWRMFHDNREFHVSAKPWRGPQSGSPVTIIFAVPFPLAVAVPAPTGSHPSTAGYALSAFSEDSTRKADRLVPCDRTYLSIRRSQASGTEMFTRTDLLFASGTGARKRAIRSSRFRRLERIVSASVGLGISSPYSVMTAT